MTTQITNRTRGERPNRRRLVFLAGLAAFTVSLAAAPARSQDKTAAIDKIFSWVAPDGPGCVAAASQHGKVVVNRAYGLADLERNVPLAPDSVFDVGSVKKQFVAAAVLLLVEEGRLALTDDVRKHVPELPDYGHTITIDHLLTHTSGIRDWVPLLDLASGDPDAMTVILRQRGLNFTPGEEWSYSNSGYVLLPEIVARASGMRFSEFVRTRLLEPLGMRATSYVDDPRFVIRNRALAYEKRGGRWMMDMLLENNRGGAGALFSTATDLLLWTDALASGRPSAFVSEKLREPATLKSGRKLTYARGLMLATNYAGPLIWHGGSAAAYKSVLGRFPEHGMSIAVLCNAGEDADARTAFAGRIFDLFASPTGTRPAEPPAPAPQAAGGALSSRTGLFFSERAGEPMRLVADGSRLRIAGGPALVPVAEDRFRRVGAALDFMSGEEFELQFVSADAFELKPTDGPVTRYHRAQPYSPGPAELNAFAGRYHSEEVGAVFQIAPGKGTLQVRLNDAPRATVDFRPVDRDTFQLGRVTIRFRRDGAGEVVALDYSNPALRRIPFTRSSAR